MTENQPVRNEGEHQERNEGEKGDKQQNHDSIAIHL